MNIFQYIYATSKFSGPQADNYLWHWDGLDGSYKYITAYLGNIKYMYVNKLIMLRVREFLHNTQYDDTSSNFR